MKIKVTLDNLGKVLKKWRSKRGLREVARDMGVSAATLSRIEMGRRPSLETFSKICKWLCVNSGEIKL